MRAGVRDLVYRFPFVDAGVGDNGWVRFAATSVGRGAVWAL